MPDSLSRGAGVKRGFSLGKRTKLGVLTLGRRNPSSSPFRRPILLSPHSSLLLLLPHPSPPPGGAAALLPRVPQGLRGKMAPDVTGVSHMQVRRRGRPRGLMYLEKTLLLSHQ